MQARQQLRGEPVGGLAVIAVHQIRKPGADDGILLQQIGDPGVDLVIIGLQVTYQGGDAVYQLGNEHGKQQVQHHQHHRPGEEDADCPEQAPAHRGGAAPFLLQSILGPEDPALQMVYEGGQQVGHGQAV